MLAPRIAYNILDEGGIMRFDEMKALLADMDVDITSLSLGDNTIVRFPLSPVFGRSGTRVSVIGAHTNPEDAESALYAEPALATRINSFCLRSEVRPDASNRPLFAFEIHGTIDPVFQGEYERNIVAGIVNLNADFREPLVEYPEAVKPTIQLCPAGCGPLAGGAGKIKQRRVIRTSA